MRKHSTVQREGDDYLIHVGDESAEDVAGLLDTWFKMPDDEHLTEEDWEIIMNREITYDDEDM